MSQWQAPPREGRGGAEGMHYPIVGMWGDTPKCDSSVLAGREYGEGGYYPLGGGVGKLIARNFGLDAYLADACGQGAPVSSFN